MQVQGHHYRTIWLKENCLDTICVIDQTRLPHEFVVKDISTADDMIVAIKDMWVRGAGLIGVAAAYGMYLGSLEMQDNESEVIKYLERLAQKFKASRPTAVNLAWAVDKQLVRVARLHDLRPQSVRIALLNGAAEIANGDIECSYAIGLHGVQIIEQIAKQKSDSTINILTHCNAGWLAFVDYGTATAPIYEAYKRGLNIHVWVDETRPRNQGASLTAWELDQQGIAHTVIADNVGGHLMQHGLVDLCIVGADRVTRGGDVANKIGTYLKALAAKDNGIPFYVALPSSTLDMSLLNGLFEIPIEQRDEEEVKYIQGWHQGELKKVLLTPRRSPAANYGFDVTPRRLVSGLITERGVCQADEQSISHMFGDLF